MARAKTERKDDQWIELCEYVKKEILQYDDNMDFPSYLALKLQGLKRGQFIANNNAKEHANYDDYTILCAFKLCRNKILDYLSRNESKIKDEEHRINLIIKMVKPEINDVYIRLKQAENRKEKIADTNFDNQFNKGAEYKKQTKKVNERMKNLF